jgi:UDP-N-acetylmuramyl tripeptide synthase
LRRGLAIPRADVAVVTNVAADHLGEMGVHTLEDLTEVKFVVRRAADHLVLNADDPEVRRRGEFAKGPITWVSQNPEDPLILAHLADGGAAALLEDGVLVHRAGEGREVLLPAVDVPITVGGLARYNVTNALCAAAAALRLGLPTDAVRRGLAEFESDPKTNPGRLNDFEFGGVRALVDFAHNPHGMQALFELVAALPHDRMAVLLGQAGDRDNTSIVDLARITAAIRPDLVVVKQMTSHLRGRTAGEVIQMIDATLREHDLPPEAIEHAPSELDAVRRALRWAQDGDLLLLLSHVERGAVLQLLTRLDREGWRAGDDLPE